MSRVLHGYGNPVVNFPTNGEQSMPLLSDYAQKKKIEYFLNPIPKDSRILEVGCGLGLASLVLTQRSADVTATQRWRTIADRGDCPALSGAGAGR